MDSFIFFLKKGSEVVLTGLLFFVVSWKEIDWDTDLFVKKGWFFRYIHSHGWGTCRSPMLALSSAIERRARGLSFPLLRIFIGYRQLPQRAGWSAKSWQNTRFCNTINHIDNYAKLSLYIVSRPLLSFYAGKGGGEDRKQWKNIQGPDGTFSYHNMNRIQSVFGHPIPSVTFGPVA